MKNCIKSTFLICNKKQPKSNALKHFIWPQSKIIGVLYSLKSVAFGENMSQKLRKNVRQ